MSASRKGFKFTRHSSKVPTDTISYDDIVDQSLHKRKRGSTAISNDNNNTEQPDQTKVSNTTSASTTDRSRNEAIRKVLNSIITPDISNQDNFIPQKDSEIVNKPNKQKKSYYPIIDYQIPSNNDMNHKKNNLEILRQCLEDICKIEKSGLESYFINKQNNSSADTLSLLINILDNLPSLACDSLDNTCTFYPEIPVLERSIVDKLHMTIETLESYNQQLCEYENQIHLLGRDFDIWISDETFPLKDRKLRRLTISDSTADIVSRYSHLLEEIEKNCECMLKESDIVTNEINNANKYQTRLYEAYADMGSDAVDIKSIIRKYK